MLNEIGNCRGCVNVDMMALLFELMSSVVGLALKPLFLANVSCQFGVRSISIVVLTWLELLRFAFFLHFVILWRLAIWSTAVLSLPVRAFTALYRERMLEMQLHRLKNEMENLLWDRNELEEQLLLAIKERNMMETLLMELEEEQDEAIVRIELLEGEVQDLKDETHRLKEIQGKALWNYWDQDNIGNDCNVIDTDDVRKSSWKPENNKNMRQMTKDDVGSRLSGLSRLYITDLISNTGNITLAEEREIALSRSLFSALLTLVVGIVVWEAEAQCMPLVVALFTVVTISLVSVLRLFTRIKRKPASEVVTLLSINWFILGTLACPMLPSVARFIAPFALRFMLRIVNLLGL